MNKQQHEPIEYTTMNTTMNTTNTTTPQGILTRDISEGFRPLLVGAPGCAKTARIRAAAIALGMRIVIMRASLRERIDFGGALVPDITAGITHELPLAILKDLRETTEPTLLFLDDLGQAPIDVQASLMSLFDEGALSPHVRIAGATNEQKHKAGVNGIIEPLRSRFDCRYKIATPGEEDMSTGPVMLGSWADEVNGWCDWLTDAHPDAWEIAAWHRSPSLGAQHPVGPVLYDWTPNNDPSRSMCDFRTWETAARKLEAGRRDFNSFASTIGKGQASAFVAFLNLVNEVPTLDEVRSDPKGALLPSKAAVLAYLSCKLAASIDAKDAKQFIQYCERMPRIFTALAVQQAYRRIGAAFTKNPDWQRWFMANQDMFLGQ